MRQRLINVASDHAGSVMVEIALVLPVVLFLTLGLLQFGILFYNYVLVTRAAELGARTLSISRLDSSPYTHTQNAITAAATNISGLTPTMSVSGTACSSDSGCQSALQAAYSTATTTGSVQPVSVTVSFSCNSNSILPADLFNLAGVCPLTVTMQAAVE